MSGTRCIGFPRNRVECPDCREAANCSCGAGADPRRGFFSGYLKDEKATEEAWRDGWFHTGDAVRRGPDGALHFVDRLKNIIRRSGENIAALEVEAAMAGHPAIAQVAVIAVPDSMRDEEVMACVVLRDGHAVAETPFPSRTGAWSGCPTSRRPATSRSSTRCRSPRPTRCRRPSSPISPSSAATAFDLRDRKTPQTHEAEAYDGRGGGGAGHGALCPLFDPAAHWWLAKALSRADEPSGLKKNEIDGLSVSSFTLAPDTAIGLTQHLGLSPRWLDQFRSAARAASSRCGVPRARCSLAMRRSWLASPATPITSIPFA